MGVKVRKRNGAWWVFINYHGQRKAKRIGSREAAERVKREIEIRLATGQLAGHTGLTSPVFNDYADLWLRHYAEVRCKQSTVYYYRQYLRLYARPRFGKHRLDEIRRDSVKEFISE